MKALNRLAIVLLLCVVPGVAAAQYYDDLYIRPSKKSKAKKAEKEQVEPIVSQETATEIYPESAYVPDSSWNVDAYNRRYTSTPTYTDTLYAHDAETVEEQPDENGYYLNGFYGTQSDLEYAERIRRFHNPRFTVHISDPAYTDIYYLNSWDWNVYIDDTYAYVTPTWTNPWYWSYTWTPYSYYPSWRWSTFYGYGYPYYGGFWGDPYWNNYYWGWGGPHYAGVPHHPGYAPRPPHYKPSYRPDGRPSQDRPNFNEGGWGTRRPSDRVNTRPGSGTRTNGNDAVAPSNGRRVREGNTSRSSQRQTTVRGNSSQQRSSSYDSGNNRSSRNSYTPSYNGNSSRGSSIGSGSGNSSRGGGGGHVGGGGSRSRR